MITMVTLIDLVLFTLLGITAIAMLRIRDLFAVVMLSGIYSLVSAVIFTDLDAVDVAFTEASVGAGISTILMLGTLALTSTKEKTPRRQSWGALLIVLVTGAALMYGTVDMPAFGDAASPINSPVTDRYITASGEETGVPNIVTSVLASYRGYDTMGETTVIFTAAIAVLILLGSARTTDAPVTPRPATTRSLELRPILRAGAKLLIGPILLFAFYVQFHGDFGPGGGFQAGVIFAAGVILYALIFDMDRARALFRPAVTRPLIALGVLIYAGTGIATLFFGGNFLGYSAFNPHHPAHGQELGIFLVELGVGITVSNVMMTLFFTFCGRRRP
ncbi:DUF4040 domain-containing protein [Insolitispirillum peregrinum]|uniref:Multisubunit sodium/proton antiporter, MrpB subunit n=1 Tax=Insolitispirillum peregrinum TaxID=80876 RepID=A0A1N7NGL6_9PROT|nr:DUF4040 domain-containing protein [Insolitispirillum peregrinum]SIS97543.1 multisubunit sodium/proton antiporter, MrpB subunit [Insolitispirillum peregrinum]